MSESPSDRAIATIERVRTADGADLAVKRRLRDGPPIVFLHGIAVHGGIWDLPEVRGPDFHYRSLSSLATQAGFDVWLVNFRGQGGPDAQSHPPPDQADWCVDHLILYDLPAVARHVSERTGRPPFVVASSMGALVLGAYLQGAVARPAVSPQQGASPIRVEADIDESRRRQAGLAGCIFCEYPAVLRWPRSLYGADGTLKWRALLSELSSAGAAANYPFEALSRWSWLEAIVGAAGEVPLDWLRNSLRSRNPLKLPRRVAEALERTEKAAVEAVLRLAGTFNGSTQHRVEVILHGKRLALDRIKAGVLRQLSKSVRQRGFVSDLGRPDHDYAAHYQNIELPLLVIAGGRDRIANAESTRAAFFDVVRSADKSFLLFEQIGHGEITAAPIASQRVYPHVLEWLAQRCRP